jgi:hypothetical protein
MSVGGGSIGSAVNATQSAGLGFGCGPSGTITEEFTGDIAASTKTVTAT